jgi:hypothetical protein
MSKLEQQVAEPRDAISRLEQKAESLKGDLYKELGQFKDAIKEMMQKVAPSKEDSSKSE